MKSFCFWLLPTMEGDMRLQYTRLPWTLITLTVAALVATPALATAPEVAAVPWNPGGGIYTNQHTTHSGYNMLLMAVATDADGDNPIISYEWDFGDATGTGPIAVAPTSGPLDIEVRHIYVGANNTPFTARLTVCDAAGDCATDDFRLVVKSLALDIEVNISIDEGLWYLHRTMSRFPDPATGEPVGRWVNSGFVASATSSAVQAFLINEHLTSNDPGEDPYVDDVVRGVNYMLTQLARVGVGNGTCAAAVGGSFNTDSNGNAYGLGVPSSRPIYESGQVMDALAATRTPLAVAVTGIPEVLGRTYEDIATDMADYYAWCQDDGGGDQGGWRYSCNFDSDNSAAQWGAIGFLGVEQVFAVPTPACVESQNLLWLNASRFTSGGLSGCFGYTGVNCIHQCMATTPSGMVQLAMDGVLPTDVLWTDAEDCICRNWAGWNLANNGNMYAYYALAKAMRGAIGGTDDLIGENNPAICPGGAPIDWYDALAAYLVNAQNANGSWTGFYWVGNGPLATAWAIIILKPTLFCPAPVADCDADPSATTIGCPVEFDGTQSFHPGAAAQIPGCGTEIVSYDWDFDDGNSASGPMASHSYAAFGNYDATLTVTDDIGVSSTATCPVSVGPPPIDPDANPDGPYELCLNLGGGSVVLDGTASLDPDNSPCAGGNGIVSCDWELDFAEFPSDFNDASGCLVDVTGFYAGMPVGIYDVGLRVTDDEGVTNDDFTTVAVRDDCPPPPCPPEVDPRSQGYWHRQCLGLPANEGGIDPGREGRGPQSPTEPDFQDGLMPPTDALLEALGFYGDTTCSGMDADPPNDMCEKALKQLTAVLLNMQSGRIAEGCEVDADASPCDSTSVGALIQEIADLIHGGECNAAKDCAAAVNEGASVLPGGGATVTFSAAVTPVCVEVETGEPATQARTVRGAQTAPRVGTRGPGHGDPGGRILYYLVPADYTADDPRVQIMSVGGPDAVEPGLTRVEAYGPQASQVEKEPDRRPALPQRSARELP
jgi:PKD repeat protein